MIKIATGNNAYLLNIGKKFLSHTLTIACLCPSFRSPINDSNAGYTSSIIGIVGWMQQTLEQTSNGVRAFAAISSTLPRLLRL